MENALLKNENGAATIYLFNSLVIDNISRIHQVFVQAYESNLPVILEMNNVTDCDCTFVQLLTSLCFSLSNKGLILDINTNRLPSQIGETISSLGFSCRNNCTRIKNMRCLLAKINEIPASGESANE